MVKEKLDLKQYTLWLWYIRMYEGVVHIKIMEFNNLCSSKSKVALYVIFHFLFTGNMKYLRPRS